MIPISVGVSSSLSTKKSPEVLVIHEDVEIAQDKEVGMDTEEDAFSDWLRSHSESGPAEAAVDSASFFGSGSASLSLGCDDYDVIPQRLRGPLPPNGVIVPTSLCRLSLPPPPVAPNVSAHEIASIISYSRDLPSAILILSQSADSPSSSATQFTHEVESDDAIAIPTAESLARVSRVQDNEAANIALSKSEVFADDVGKHTLGTWLFSPPEFDTGEDSKESYSAVQPNPVPTEFDSSDEYKVLATRASSRVHLDADFVREESNGYSIPSLFSTGPSELCISTPLFRDSQPSSFLESSSTSFVSVTLGARMHLSRVYMVITL